MRIGLFVFALMALCALSSSSAHAQTPFPDPYAGTYGPELEEHDALPERIPPPAPRDLRAQVLETNGAGRRFLKLGDGWLLASSGVSLRPTSNMRVRDESLAVGRSLWGGRLLGGGWRSKLSREGLPRLETDYLGLQFNTAF